MQEFITCSAQDVGNPVNPFLGQGPIARIDAVSNGREKCRIISGP